jgi:hypothetical protein
LPNREQKKAERHRLIRSEYDAENASHSRVWLNLDRGFCSGIALAGKAEETEQIPAEGGPGKPGGIAQQPSPVPAAQLNQRRVRCKRPYWTAAGTTVQ